MSKKSRKLLHKLGHDFSGRQKYRLSKKKWPILYSKLLNKNWSLTLGHTVPWGLKIQQPWNGLDRWGRIPGRLLGSRCNIDWLIDVVGFDWLIALWCIHCWNELALFIFKLFGLDKKYKAIIYEHSILQDLYPCIPE